MKFYNKILLAYMMIMLLSNNPHYDKVIKYFESGNRYKIQHIISENNIKTPEDIKIWLITNITYKSESLVYKYDFWQTPLETIEFKYGDCEDFAILSKALLQELNIPSDLYLMHNDNQGGHCICVFWYKQQWHFFDTDFLISDNNYHKNVNTFLKEYFRNWDWLKI